MPRPRARQAVLVGELVPVSIVGRVIGAELVKQEFSAIAADALLPEKNGRADVVEHESRRDRRERQQSDQQACRGEHVESALQLEILCQLNLFDWRRRHAADLLRWRQLQIERRGDALHLQASVFALRAQQIEGFGGQRRSVVREPDFVDVHAMDPILVDDLFQLLDPADDLDPVHRATVKIHARIERRDNQRRARTLAVHELDRRAGETIGADDEHSPQILGCKGRGVLRLLDRAGASIGNPGHGARED